MEKPLTAEDKLLKVFRSMDANRTGTIELKEFVETMSVLDAALFSMDNLKGMLEVADSNKDGIVQYEEFIEWLFGKKQQKMAMSVGTAALMTQLLAVEGNELSEHQLLSKIQTVGACMIASVHLNGPDEITMLEIYKFLRALFSLKIWDSDVRLIKSDGPRFFIFAVTPAKALHCALKMQTLIGKFTIWLGSVYHKSAHLEDTTLSIGIQEGALVLIEGDCYGDPVNVASKLGEDIAEPGQMIISETCVFDTTDTELTDLLKVLDQEKATKDISGLTLSYRIVKPNAEYAVKLEAEVHCPTLEETQSHLDVCMEDGEILQKTCVVMTTDLSGFTRLTKQYGILHFLRLVLKCRSIIVPAVNAQGGHKIKYEGDNVIAEFPNTDSAMCAIAEMWREIAEFNNGRQKDFQIRAGAGLGLGEVSILGHDIVGPGFEQSFHLGEEVAQVGEILITPDMQKQGWPSLTHKATVSELRDIPNWEELKCHNVTFEYSTSPDATSGGGYKK